MRHLSLADCELLCRAIRACNPRPFSYVKLPFTDAWPVEPAWVPTDPTQCSCILS